MYLRRSERIEEILFILTIYSILDRRVTSVLHLLQSIECIWTEGVEVTCEWSVISELLLLSECTLQHVRGDAADSEEVRA